MEHVNVKSRTALIVVIALITAWAFWANGITLGQDLKGGTNLRFSLDFKRAREGETMTAARRAQILEETITVIRDRIDRYGLAETNITSLGDDKFEISLPAGSETEGIVRVVTALGDLLFRVEVLPKERYFKDEAGTPPRLQSQDAAVWPWPKSAEEFDAFKAQEVERWKEADGQSKQFVHPKGFLLVRKKGATGTTPEDFHLLEDSDDARIFTGKILSDPTVGEDSRSGEPVALFKVKTDYQNVFGQWTDKNRLLPMAIVLNGEYNSAPRILSKLTTDVQVSLGMGTFEQKEAEAKELATVLQTGSLTIRPQKESHQKIGARLAGESRDRGVLATIVAFAVVLLFMIYFYRGAGMVANFALLLNLLLTVGILAFFKAALTLPGIAGIVLTLGMAVDANILINERIREELKAGRTLRRALAEGYDRALTTIVDANLTTLITALFLYIYGSGPIKGFAITLAIGIGVSMFTAIYVTRTIFEWAASTGRMREFKMSGTGKVPSWRWVRLRRLFVPLSTIGVLFGLGIFATADPLTIYDIDFTGGFKLQARFTKPTTVDDVRRALDGGARDVTVQTMKEDESGVLTKTPLTVKAGPYPGVEILSVGDAGDQVEVNVQRLGSGATRDLPIELQGEVFQEYARIVLADRIQPEWIGGDPKVYAAASAEDPLKEFAGGLHLRITLHDPRGAATAENVATALREKFPYYTDQGSDRRASTPADARLDRKVEVKAVGEPGGALKTFDVYLRTKDADGRDVENRPEKMRSYLGEYLGSRGFRTALADVGADEKAAQEVTQSDPFPTLDLIGSSVAQKLKNDALIALVLSMIGIIVYVAVRFKSKAMGFSAVLCLFHDVAISLGIASLVNMFGLVDAKINMPLVAAILTLVGYSVNDTVVIFDRIRENRGKRQLVTPQMIDDSLNQTFSRSIRTNATFFMVCIVLFVFNIGQRNVLEGFAFLLIVGAIVGTYSSVAIAAPLLLFLPWFWDRVKAYAPRFEWVSRVASNVATVILSPIVFVLWLAWWAVFATGVFLAGLVLFPYWAVAVEPEAAAIA